MIKEATKSSLMYLTNGIFSYLLKASMTPEIVFVRTFFSRNLTDGRRSPSPIVWARSYNYFIFVCFY